VRYEGNAFRAAHFPHGDLHTKHVLFGAW
jgi:hypothetical protein